MNENSPASLNVTLRNRSAKTEGGVRQTVMKKIAILVGNKTRRFGLFALLAMLALLAPESQAAYGTNITDMVSDATTLFTSIQTLVILVVGFGIAISFVKLAKKK